MSKMELRLAGSGGQGVILATVILAEAAVIAGKNTAQSQSYGPEARGGSCKAEVIVFDELIGFTKVLRTAAEKVGKAFTANIVAVAAVNRLLGLVDDEHLKEAVFMHIPKGTEAINGKALEEGFRLADSVKAE